MGYFDNPIEPPKPQVFPTLYHAYNSLECIMVRYAYCLGQLANPNRVLHVNEVTIDFGKQENFDERYITEIDEKGELHEVPVLKDFPLPFSKVKGVRDITIAITRNVFPTLLPPLFEDQIIKNLGRIAELKMAFYTITYGDLPDLQDQLLGIVNDKLQETENPHHHRALAKKLDELPGMLEGRLSTRARDEAEGQIRGFLVSMGDIRKKTTGELNFDEDAWLFPGPDATALDAHFLVIVKRLIDIQRADLIPMDVLFYARKMMSMSCWTNFWADSGRRNTLV